MSDQSQKKENVPHTGTAAQKYFKPFLVFGVALLVAVGLMQISTPRGNLVPYQKVKLSAAGDDKAGEKTGKPAKKDADAKTAPGSGNKAADAPKEPGKNAGPAPLDKELQAFNDSVKPVLDAAAPPRQSMHPEASAHLRRAMELVEATKYNESEAEFEKAAASSPNSHELYSIWATAERMQKKFKAADKYYAKADELKPNDEDILFNWGLSKLMAMEGGKAIELFKKVIQINPNHYLAYNALGKAVGRDKEFALEESYYRKSLEIKPDHAETHFNMGVVLSLQKKFEEAVPFYEKAISMDQHYAQPFVMRFLTMYKTNNNKKKEEPAKEQTASLPGGKAAHSEGSDHKMDDLKAAQGGEPKTSTNVAGKVTLNGKPLSANTVILLETKDKLPTPGQEIKDLTIVQQDLKFTPQHSVVRLGANITFVNRDMEVHNIYSKSLRNQFNLGAMAAGSSKTIKLADAGPVVLRCNLHDKMLGTIFVLPNGYYTQPDANGEFFFKDLMNKEYFMQAWHPRIDPDDVNTQLKSIGLAGKDVVYNFNYQSAIGEAQVHDLVDDTDYDAIVGNIEKEVYQAIEDWKNGNKYLPVKRMLMAITKHYDGEGLKGALAKSFSEKRSADLEGKLDSIRRKIAGLDKSKVTETGLKQDAALVISQLRVNVEELKARIHPNFENPKSPEHLPSAAPLAEAKGAN